jgi:AraC-like DNA-binding protein
MAGMEAPNDLEVFSVTPALVASPDESAAEIIESMVPVPSEFAWTSVADAGSAGFASRYTAYRPRLRFRGADPKGRCDTYNLSPWMIMAVVDVDGCTAFDSRVYGQDIVEFHFRVSGSVCLAGPWGKCSAVGPSCLLWFQPTGCDDVEERLGASARETWVSLYCDHEWLAEMLGAPTGLLGSAAGFDGKSAPPSFRVCRQIEPMLPVLKDIIRARRDDPLHWLFASTKANELLYITLRNASALLPAFAPAHRLRARDRQQLATAREILAAEFVAPPGLAALARRVGMNSSKLCFGFRCHFGETTSDFIRRLRLGMAYDLLRTSGLQVRQIAFRAGYSHHSTFTAAFVRQFGVAPKLIRCRSAESN